MSEQKCKKIFGTDGIRGIANIDPITVEMAVKLGRAAAYVFKKNEGRHRIVIGKDTRLSCYMIENALVAGICSMGVDTLVVGPLPTPGVAFITRSLRADAGIVISASHNAYQDNGIKFFGADGYKLALEVEAEIEKIISTGEINSIRPTKTEIGKSYRIDDALGRYVEYAKTTFPKGLTLDGMKIVLDCANGAAYKAAPCVLRELGADIIVYNNEPDGTNINKNCGSTSPEGIRKAVIEHKADVGIAVDGDADRVLLVDENAQIVDGDQIVALIAKDWKKKNKLTNNCVVSTIIGNLGVEKHLDDCGIKTVRCDVGDKNVIYTMKEHGAELGGESCGHIIVHEVNTTGDGIMAALQVLAVLKQNNISLGDASKGIIKYPSVGKNILVRTKPPVEELLKVQEIIKKYEKIFDGKGRIIVRYSGTEMKLRLLVEGEDPTLIKDALNALTKSAKEEIGA